MRGPFVTMIRSLYNVNVFDRGALEQLAESPACGAPAFTGELMLRWEQTEFLLKGLYLGLLVLVAWQMPSRDDIWQIVLYAAGGLILCLGVTAVRKLREGYRIHGRPLRFLLFRVLPNPRTVHAHPQQQKPHPPPLAH